MFVRVATAGLVGVTLLAAAGCACGGAEASDAAGRDAGRDVLVDAPPFDAPRLDGGPTTEVCADGIRRVEVDLEPLPVPTHSRRLDGRADHLIVVEVYGDEGVPRTLRLTVADLEGTVLATHEARLPAVGIYSPVVVRGDGPYEVLLYSQDWPQFLIVEVGDGAVAAPHVVETDLGAPGFWAAAEAARGGYVALGVFGGSPALVAVERAGATVQPVDLPGRGSGETAMSDLTSTGLVFATATGREGRHGSITRIDTSTFPFAVEALEFAIEPTIFEPQSVSVSVVPGGVVAGFAVHDLFRGVRYHWLDEDLVEHAVAEIETGSVFVHPTGVTGPGPQAVALIVSGIGGAGELRAGIAYVPGSIVGGARALATDVDGHEGEIWTPATGGMSIAYWRGGAPEIVTLCAPP